MNLFASFLAPFVLLLPAAAVERADVAAADGGARATPEPEKPVPMGSESRATERLRVLDEARRPPEAAQVRIEQRVIIRISPSSAATRQRLLADLPRATTTTTRFQEKKLDGCISIDGIAGVQPAQENRLLLFMRDHRVLTAALERACNSEDYYSGFYVERNQDGQICAKRDKLQSRAGASCKVAQLNRLVALRD
jgi:hypothetical protein